MLHKAQAQIHSTEPMTSADTAQWLDSYLTNANLHEENAEEVLTLPRSCSFSCIHGTPRVLLSNSALGSSLPCPSLSVGLWGVLEEKRLDLLSPAQSLDQRRGSVNSSRLKVIAHTLNELHGTRAWTGNFSWVIKGKPLPGWQRTESCQSHHKAGPWLDGPLLWATMTFLCAFNDHLTERKMRCCVCWKRTWQCGPQLFCPESDTRPLPPRGLCFWGSWSY